MPPATLSTILTRLRTDLQDASAAIWSDAELTSHVDRAVRELSNRIPRERAAMVATTAGSRVIGIAGLTDLIAVEAVEWPVGAFPKRYQPFGYFAGTLELTGPDLPDGTNCAVYWLSPQTLDGSTSTVPVHLEDLILIGAGAYALLDQAAATPNAVNTGGGAAAIRYRELGEGRLSAFRAGLEKHGRRNRIRPVRLFAPAYPVASQGRDPGP